MAFSSKGEGGLDKIILKHESGSQLEVYLNGGTVTSFIDAEGRKVIFMSSTPIFKEGKGIRGGIPICWPQFGPGDLPQHGFARSTPWTLKSSTSKNSSGNAQLILTLSDSETTHKIWNHSFLLEQELTFDATTLTQTLKVLNLNSKESFSFTGALHSYFPVSSIDQIELEGLQGLTFVDKTDNNSQKLESRSRVPIPNFTDSVFLNAPNQILLHDKGAKRTLVIFKSGFRDVVVWNPWKEGSKQYADLGENDWKSFVCVESATAFLPGHTVEAGKRSHSFGFKSML